MVSGEIRSYCFYRIAVDTDYKLILIPLNPFRSDGAYETPFVDEYRFTVSINQGLSFGLPEYSYNRLW